MPSALAPLLLALLVLLAVPPGASAQPADMGEVVDISVIPGWRRGDGVHVAGLRFNMRPGWKTYWRSAGATGIAPRFDWRATRGVRSVTPSWPTPRAFGPAGARSIGYARDFVLPLLVVPDGDGAVRLRGTLDFGVCADICIPARMDIAADLPAGGYPVPEIAAALRDRPRRMDASARCRIAPTADGLAVSAEMRLPPLGGSEAVVFELPDPSVWVGEAAVRRAGGSLHAKAEMIAGGRGPLAFDRSALRMTVIGESDAVEVLGCAG